MPNEPEFVPYKPFHLIVTTALSYGEEKVLVTTAPENVLGFSL
jgi:hypothetical protein